MNVNLLILRSEIFKIPNLNKACYSTNRVTQQTSGEKITHLDGMDGILRIYWNIYVCLIRRTDMNTWQWTKRTKKSPQTLKASTLLYSGYPKCSLVFYTPKSLTAAFAPWNDGLDYINSKNPKDSFCWIYTLRIIIWSQPKKKRDWTKEPVLMMSMGQKSGKTHLLTYKIKIWTSFWKIEGSMAYSMGFFTPILCNRFPVKCSIHVMIDSISSTSDPRHRPGRPAQPMRCRAYTNLLQERHPRSPSGFP